MTIFGIDISKYQYDVVKHEPMPMHLVKDQGYTFVTARSSIGDSEDPLYAHFRHDCHLHGLAFAAYHYITNDVPMHVQAQLLKEVVTTAPVMIDAEKSGLSWCQIEQFIEACYALKVDLKSLYLPEWFWGQIGRPNLTQGPASRLALIQSNYGQNLHGYGSKVYPGDKSPHWNGYGGKNVSILQFGSSIKIDGWPSPVDGDAYRGDLHSLKASGLFYFWKI